MTDIGPIKHKVRTLAAQVKRPVTLHDAAAQVCGGLSAAEATAIVVEQVAGWILSGDELVRMTLVGTLLCGPAPSSDDPDAWDDV
jgi:hypothetical protein